MGFIYTDPGTAAPFITFQIKDVVTKAFKLTSAHFSTGGTNTLVGVLPSDATILRISYWNKTKLAGNSISAATLSLGSASAGTQFVNAYNVFTTVSTYAALSPVTGIFQEHDNVNRTDIQLWVNGTSTTGTPTSGEIYLLVEYVR